ACPSRKKSITVAYSLSAPFTCVSFALQSLRCHPLYSFPTRRSSDLWAFVSTRSIMSRILAMSPGLTSWPESRCWTSAVTSGQDRSEEHTSELQSRSDLVCRPLLEKNIGFGFKSKAHSQNIPHRFLQC